MNCGPILCICYTNHALDQFLEHLLEKGIKSIVRIGGGCKSEQLKDYSLEQLMRSQDKSQDTRQALRDGKSQWEMVSQSLMEIDQALQNGTLPWKFLSSHLMERCYEQYQQLNPSANQVQDVGDGSDDDEGFKVVEGKNTKDPYLRWITGFDIKRKQEYLAELRNGRSRQTNPNSNMHSNMYERLSHYVNSDNGISTIDRPPSDGIDMQQIRIPMTNRPLSQLKRDGDMWNMSMDERQRLNDSWKRPVQQSMLEELSRLLMKCQAIEQNVNNAYDEVRRLILKKTSVIGMTTNGAAKYQSLISYVAPRIIVCEEAGEVLESHILATLSPSTLHLILIGDPLQLRPQVATYSLSTDSPIGKNYNLDKSLFERLVTPSLNLLPISYLTTQRRMRPEIADLVRHTLYPKLDDGGAALKYPPVGGMKMDLFFMSHTQPEDKKDQLGMQSFSNSFEVNMVEALVQYLIRNGYNQRGDIAILTPYLGQLVKLRDRMKKSFMLVIDERDQEQLDEIDLQVEEGDESSGSNQNLLRANGEEAKIVIISLVRNIRTEDGAGHGIGFLKSPNRTNVLLSRAQHGMYLIGNAELLSNSTNEAGLWPKVVDELREEGRIGPGFRIACQRHPDTQRLIDTPEKFKVWAPHGGCNLPCSYNMDCGHVCPYQCRFSNFSNKSFGVINVTNRIRNLIHIVTCHSDDPRHELVRCPQPCPRLHSVCNHACPKQCGDDCGNCMEMVNKITLLCGHTYNNPRCWQAKDPLAIDCKVPVIRKMITCEHENLLSCSDNVINARCTKPCGKILQCGHPCTRNCYDCQELTKSASKKRTDTAESDVIKRTRHGPCRQVCNSNLFCGHVCVASCHPKNDCPPCTMKCATRCAHFTCERPCNEKCPACCEPCVWECLHGERCPLPCGVPCNRLPCNKRCGKTLDCGHRCPSVCGEVCPSKKFCVLCADEKTKDMLVDLVMHQSLRDINVDEDPLLVLSCGHALTMSSLDGMMEMSQYYIESGATTEACPEFTACRPLPSEEVMQKACHLCRKPIVELHRYGRRIKFSQLSTRSKKYIKEQQTKVKRAKAELQVAQDSLEESGPKLISSITKILKSPSAPQNPSIIEEPAIATRLLRSIPRNQLPSPTKHYKKIRTTYSIPENQAIEWEKHVSYLLKCHRAFVDIYESACNSPAKQLFDAAVSHLYRLKTVGSTGQFGITNNPRIADIEQASASTVISECIRECGIPPGGMDGSSFMESFQEIINVQILLHQQAVSIVDTVGTSSGWYWFAYDLIHSIEFHAERLIIAATEAKYLRHLAYAQLSLMLALHKKVQLLGRKPMAANETMIERCQLVDLQGLKFREQMEKLRRSCPLGIRDECLARIEVLEKDMESAIRIAESGVFYAEVTKEEKLQLFSAMLPEVGGASHWFRCPNNHPVIVFLQKVPTSSDLTYTIGECGGAMQQSTCPECGAAIGGGHHTLTAGNSVYTDFQGMSGLWAFGFWFRYRAEVFFPLCLLLRICIPKIYLLVCPTGFMYSSENNFCIETFNGDLETKLE
ncbi:LOW QUALITY PROTEIN: hypothetical protein BC937DRAFT_90815 [Endogone sp. FLAS-F59071]|nr:LOW QUALITY PROTEIN: hypothetical protein BC937DRAFT_90815 [Endogone sp. FLAS-F59071]|eukprot:RUS16781.1 LOW QUALITY PROTEIN: hypothetical protein BC937DRAFT_90815 [Endogone sp. FLAS-F59071]